jgi:dTDP-4-amino-4,6-dideoxygalactose transaminase
MTMKSTQGIRTHQDHVATPRARREYRIPFNRPFLVGKELHYISQAVISGRLAGDGQYSKRCQDLIERKFKAKKVLLTHSCTAALEMSALLCNLQEGDEVITPSFTFVSTANAFALQGAVPVFVDIRPDNLNLDESLIEAAITPRTKVIAPVHYAGVACEMDAILEIARRHNLRVVEDAAHGFNATWRGHSLGTIGDLGTYSYHETKNCISGEGGALVINDPALVERAEIIREKGTNRAKFFRGEVDKYTWVDVGSSYLPSEVTAAFLYAQLEVMDQIDDRRRAIYRRYQQAFFDLQQDGCLRLPIVSEGCHDNAHMFYVLLQDGDARQRLASHLADRGIHAVSHYVPLHSSPMGSRLGRAGSRMTVTDDMAERLLRLPMFYELADEEQDEVVAAVREFFGR